MAENTHEGECPHCGEHFDHLPAHQWQCPEKPEENDENDISDESESTEGTEGTEPERDGGEPDNQETDKGTNEVNESSSNSNSGVIVDQVKPDEKDTRKNKDESEAEENQDESDDWVKLDYNDGKQVKTILETTDVSEPRDAQKLLKAFKTGNADDIPKFSEIRLSDGELR